MLQIRQTKYRDKAGFLCCGYYQEQRYSIFFDGKNQAKEFVNRLKAGEISEIILNDIWNIGIKKAEGR